MPLLAAGVGSPSGSHRTVHRVPEVRGSQLAGIGVVQRAPTLQSSLRGKPMPYERTLEHRQKMSVIQKAKSTIPAGSPSRVRAGEKHRALWADPDYREKMLAKKRGRQYSELELEARAKSFATYYRRKKPSAGEAEMIAILEEVGVRYQFQVPIWRFVVDFLVWPNVVLEVDHPNHRKGRFKGYDASKDAQLTDLGFTVVRVPWYPSGRIPTVRGTLEHQLALSNGQKKTYVAGRKPVGGRPRKDAPPWKVIEPRP